MILFSKTRHNLRQTLGKYFCMRMRFRGSVLVAPPLHPSAAANGGRVQPPQAKAAVPER
jgi:hypothetical protein